jgi:hypothetical protein
MGDGFRILIRFSKAIKVRSLSSSHSREIFRKLHNEELHNLYPSRRPVGEDEIGRGH